MDERRPAPEVTVRDPARPGVALDALLLSDEQPSQGSRRRSATAWVAGLGLLGVLATGLGLEHRADEDEARRLASAVDLTALAVRPADVQVDAGARQARLGLVVRLRNQGSGEITVLEAQDEELTLSSPLTLAAGARGTLGLVRDIDCSTTLPPTPLAGSALLLRVRTPGGERTAPLRLVAPAGDGAALRACGFLPLEQTVEVRGRDAEQSGATARLRLTLTVASARPLALTELVAPPWLRLDLARADGTAASLPLPLDVAATEPSAVTSLRLSLAVADCPAAEDALATGRLVRVRVLVRDERGRLADRTVDVDALVRALAAQGC